MRGFFGGLWRVLDGVRRFLHLVLLLALFGFIAGALRTSIPKLPDQAALLLQPEGAIVEQLSGDPIQRAFDEAQGGGRSETLLWDLVDAIDAAKDDDRIKALVLDLQYLGGGGQPTMEELTHSIAAFRKTGKKVIALGTSFMQDQYYLASQADEIYLDPLGLVLIDGYDRYRMFYKNALDKLGVDMNVYRVGVYKSAVEPYTRTDMSPEDREESFQYLSSLWTTYQDAIVKARELPADAVAKYVATYADTVRASKGDAAQVALDAGLITGVKNAQEVEQRLIELVGEDTDERSYRKVTQRDYLRVLAAEKSLQGGRPTIGVIVAAGEMLDGDQPAGTVGGASTARLIREARLDEDVKAVVIRVDTPGGSVLAAEQIHREIEALKADGKPVIVSMGDLAASGGYYIAAPADEIWASPATITGSIGIFAVIPTVNRTLKKLGVTVDGVGTTPLSGQLRLDRPIGPDAGKLLQSTVERGYEIFLERVAEGRGKTRDEVNEIAQGRVWAGRDAKRLGLVDELGSFRQAVESAARHAELDEGSYDVEFVQPKLSWAQELALQVKTFAVSTFLELDTGSSALMRLAGHLDPVEEEVARWTRLRGSAQPVYAYCFCAAP